MKATNFTPLASEIIVYDSDENYDYPRIKIGDGKTNVNGLPFLTKDYAKISDIPTKPEDIGALPDSTVIPTVPTKVSAFENDAGYLTEHQSLEGLATEEWVEEKFEEHSDFVAQPEAPEDINVLWIDTDDDNTGSGGNAGFVVQPTAPEDTSVLWVDPDDDTEDGSQNGGIAVTGATMGQTVKIAAVDENGVPTAWEPTDFPSGAGWRLIADITLEEEVKGVDISTDMDGNPVALGAYYLIAKTVPAVNTEDRFTNVKINTNGVTSMGNIIYNTTAKNNIYLSDFCILAGNANPIHFVGAYDLPYNWGYSVMSTSPYHQPSKMYPIKKITICPNDYTKVFGGAGTEIKLYGIDI